MESFRIMNALLLEGLYVHNKPIFETTDSNV